MLYCGRMATTRDNFRVTQRNDCGRHKKSRKQGARLGEAKKWPRQRRGPKLFP